MTSVDEGTSALIIASTKMNPPSLSKRDKTNDNFARATFRFMKRCDQLSRRYENKYTTTTNPQMTHHFPSRKKQHANPTIFWLDMEDYLVAQAQRYVKSDVRPRESYLIILAGEASGSKEFLDTIDKVVARIQADEAHKSKRTGSGPKIEIFVCQEPIFAAAIGAAFSKRMELDSSYCAEYYESGRKVTEVLEDDHRDEL